MIRNRFCLAAVILLASSTARGGPPGLDHLYPAGGRRGETVEVTAGGKFDHWPVQVWVDAPGLTVEPAADKGKLRIAVAADAAPGLRWLRLHDAEGASPLRPFLVGTLPEILEAEPNDAPSKAQPVDLCGDAKGVVVNGRLGKSDDVDGFRLDLQKGQTLVAAVEANTRLGSPMDAVLQVASPDGFVLAMVDDDGSRDPLLIYRAEADGPVVVRLFAFPATPDSRIRFSGGDAFIYRLTLTSGAYADYPYPLAVARSSPQPVEPVGWHISSDIKDLCVSPGPADVFVLGHPLLANTVEVAVEPHPARIEPKAEPQPSGPNEPNPGPDRPVPNEPSEVLETVELPVTISGRIEPNGDRDRYRFAARKGESLTFRVDARSLGLPLDPVLRVLDESGKTLAEVDDSGRRPDPELTFKPDADGTYMVEVRDLNGRGGPRHAYRLRATPTAPEVELTLPSDRITVTPGKPTEIAVKINRKNGYSDTVGFAFEGLPDGLTLEPAVSEPKGDTAKAVTLKLSAAREPWSGPVRLKGRSGSGPELPIAAPIDGRESTTTDLWLTVLPAPAQEPAKPAGS